MSHTRRGSFVVVVAGCLLAASWVQAQDVPEAESPTGSEAEAGASVDEAGTGALGSDDPFTDTDSASDADSASALDEGTEADTSTPEADTASTEAEAEASAAASVDLSVSGAGVAPTAGGEPVDGPASEEDEADGDIRIAGSHIRGPRLTLEDGTMFGAGPLRTTFADRMALEQFRATGGISVTATAAALGLGAPATFVALRSRLRMQPTVFLLNGRRMVNAPFADLFGADLVDLDALPITLISRIETTTGNVSALYGDGAVGGVVNFVTHRNYDGVELDVGGLVTSSFDQHQADVTLTTGAGDEKTGMNVMVSYFNRQPLAASDRDWVSERLERHESIVSHPLSYQPLLNFTEYPVGDPGCAAATQAGDATGTELRIPLFGEPMTRAGGNAIDLLPTSPLDYQAKYRGGDFDGRGNMDGSLQAGETATYCGNDMTRFQDLILEEERLQTYATFWHAFSDHVEGFGELGYYRNENLNRAPPSFPVSRISPDLANVEPVIVPKAHADIPIRYKGYAIADNVPVDAREPNDFFLVGTPLPLHAGANVQERRVDTFRGVLGLKGDMEELGAGSVLESWDWELAGVYSETQKISRVPDVLLDRLGDALNSCVGSTVDMDVASETYLETIPSTIKDRQEAGCYNPFYSSVANNVAVDPLNLSNGNVPNDRGFINTDSEADSQMEGFGLQDGGYICDPAVNPEECPAALDPDQDGVYELAGTPNTKQVVDRLTGQHVTLERRSLATADLMLSGNLAEFDGGRVALALGGQFRRETLAIDFDAAFNQRRYAFLFGAPDVEPVGRNIGAAFAEMRMGLMDGLLEVQGAGRVEHFENVGTAISPMGGLALRPFASGSLPALEWLLVRGHVGLGHRAPSLLQQYGTFTSFRTVEFDADLHFVPHQVVGNPNLDFEKFTTLSGGVQWDHLGFHVGADFWLTMAKDVISADNSQTLVRDCDLLYKSVSRDCAELKFVDPRLFNHVESPFDNLAEVDTSGIDGSISYALDTQRRGLGDMGTFSLGLRGRYINSFLIRSPRALREYYRPGGELPSFKDDGSLDYSNLTAEYEAAGYRNLENFAPPMPQLRMSVPLRWFFGGHMVGATMRFVGGYFDDSESTIEKYGLAQELAGGESPGTLAIEDGEEIPAWTVFDLNYGFLFGDASWQTQVALGVINLLDEPPPGAESGLGYDVGIHDPRGRMFYARVTGKF
ncbi:MAG: TonB-dependent receptor [Myxococcales bacterium]|nr:TonB-dependent receptor [Myxococcales bacterium]